METLSYEDWKNKFNDKKQEAFELLTASLAPEYGPDLRYVSSGADFPCLYTKTPEEDEYIFYYGRKKIPTRPLPVDFHWKAKPGVHTTHISPVGCPFLEVGMEVDCFAYTFPSKTGYQEFKEKYYYTTHPVGSCPWKTCGE